MKNTTITVILLSLILFYSTACDIKKIAGNITGRVLDTVEYRVERITDSATTAAMNALNRQLRDSLGSTINQQMAAILKQVDAETDVFVAKLKASGREISQTVKDSVLSIRDSLLNDKMKAYFINLRGSLLARDAGDSLHLIFQKAVAGVSRDMMLEALVALRTDTTTFKMLRQEFFGEKTQILLDTLVNRMVNRAMDRVDRSVVDAGGQFNDFQKSVAKNLFWLIPSFALLTALLFYALYKIMNKKHETAVKTINKKHQAVVTHMKQEQEIMARSLMAADPLTESLQNFIRQIIKENQQP